MLRKVMAFSLSFLLVLFMAATGFAHFGMIIPSDDMVTQEDTKDVSLEIRFVHPFEGHLMNMVKPKRFGILTRGKNTDLTEETLKKELK